jgi:glycosyltransferase involved in cell wall biosynthesis
VREPKELALTPFSRGAVLVHDFFVQDGGAERCAIELARLLPRAPVYTTFFDRQRFGDRLDARRIHPWKIQRLLRGHTFRGLLPLYPAYFSLLDLRGASLVVSSSVAFSKAVRTSEGALHISYVYTPMRYAWDLEDYLRGSSYSALARAAARGLRRPLIRWDRRSARGPDILVAISETVRQRIRQRWGRESELIYPPVDTSEFVVSGRDDGFLLVASRLLAYRRLELAVNAANMLRRELVIVGEGPERRRLEASAGPTIRFMGELPRSQLVELFEHCHAYVLPGVEDFGLAPLEAMACGKPVVAYAAGGALETVVDGETGVFFRQPEARSLADAIGQLDSLALDQAPMRARAEQFDRQQFVTRWRALFRRLGVDPGLYDTG